MGVKKIKKVLTAIGNPILNNELRKINNLNIINNDVQYQDGIFEILEINSEINFIILNPLISGNLNAEEMVEKIQNINSKIKIILILEEYDESLEKVLMKQGVYRIFYNNKIEIKDIVKIINEDEKMEKYNEEIRREIEELKNYIKNNNRIEREEYEENINKNNYIKNNKFNNNNNKNNKEKYIKNNYKINNQINTQKTIINKINNLNKLFINKIKKINLLQENNLDKNIIKKINKYYFKDKCKDKCEDEINKCKIISILGNNGSGKSTFAVMLAKVLKEKNKKILIIDFDILNNSLHTILGVSKYPEKIKKILKNNNIKNKINIENLIIKINKKIDLISGINLIFDSVRKINEEKIREIINKLSNFYNYIIIDTTSECFFEYTKEIIKISDESVFLTEANLSEISKSKRFLELYSNNWNIKNDKIKIVFNKVDSKSIDIELLKKLYADYQILGKIKLKKDYNKIINNNIERIQQKNNKFIKYNLIESKLF